MQSEHTARHTRRGFLRGDATPKFFPLIKLSECPELIEDWHPLLLPSAATDVAPALAPAPPAQVQAAASPDAQPVPLEQELFDFSPKPAHFLHDIDDRLASESGHAFLSWLADQITGQANENGVPKSAAPEAGAETIDFTPDDDFDPHIALEFDDNDYVSDEHDHLALDLSYELEAAYNHEEDHCDTHMSTLMARGKQQPHVEVSADGGRLEVFEAGSRVVKDMLGRVVAVHSQYGDCLYFRYGVFGKLEYFQRTDDAGRTHSEGRRDKHGVVVRDSEGRVRAAGESMTVDPRGCFYLHGIDGQYFSLDLVTGTHSERRCVMDDRGGARFVTSLFAHDGFRMATMFGPSLKSGTAHGGVCRYRFYGRDGTVIEFDSDDDLLELQPARVSAPAVRPVHQGWLSRRQAGTAWESIHEYLMRVS